MKQNTDSDFTMAASKSFFNVLQEIQVSGLNFKIELCPFSAIIYLKNSFLKNKAGVIIQPPTLTGDVNEVQKLKISQLEQEIESLNQKLKLAAFENEKCHDTIAKLNVKQEITDIKTIKIEELEDDLKLKCSELYNTKVELAKQYGKGANEINKLEYYCENLKAENKDIISDKVKLEEEILFLTLSDKNQREINKRLNLEMVKSRTRLIKEKEEESKHLKNDIKLWKKKLGKEKKKVIKLKTKICESTSVKSIAFPSNPIAEDKNKNESKDETELEEAVTSEVICAEEISCSICADPLFFYTPKFCEGLPINPACSKCKDSGDESEEDNVDDVLIHSSPCTTPPLAQPATPLVSPPVTSTTPATGPLTTTTSAELYEDLVKFIESGPDGNIDIMIFKLESLKNMLQTTEFDSLLENAKKLRNEKETPDDDYEDEEFYDDLPPYHYGSDGEVIID